MKTMMMMLLAGLAATTLAADPGELCISATGNTATAKWAAAGICSASYTAVVVVAKQEGSDLYVIESRRREAFGFARDESGRKTQEGVISGFMRAILDHDPKLARVSIGFNVHRVGETPILATATLKRGGEPTFTYDSSISN